MKIYFFISLILISICNAADLENFYHISKTPQLISSIADNVISDNSSATLKKSFLINFINNMKLDSVEKELEDRLKAELSADQQVDLKRILNSPFYQKFLKVTLKVEADYERFKIMLMTTKTINYSKERFTLTKNIVGITKDNDISAYLKIPLKKIEIVYSNIKKEKNRRYPKIKIKNYLKRVKNKQLIRFYEKLYYHSFQRLSLSELKELQRLVYSEEMQMFYKIRKSVIRDRISKSTRTIKKYLLASINIPNKKVSQE